MSINRPNFPQGPLTTSSLTRFHDIVVGEAKGNVTEKIVMRVYGSVICSQNITTVSLTTDPGGAFLSNQTLTNLVLPINPSDAANKEYVDSVATGLNIKAPVKAATTGNIILSGVQVIDGYLSVVGDRILVKDQTLPVENGLYNVAAGAWTRTTDLPTGSSAAKTTVQVENGTINKNSTWVCTSILPNDITGVDPLYWTLFSSGLVPGAGLSQSGNVLNVNVDNIGIQINGLNQLEIKPGGITNADLQNSSITINTSNGVSGGAIVQLGSNVNLSVDSTVVRTFGLQTISGNKLFNDPIGLMVGINGIFLTAAPLTLGYSFTFPINGGLAGQVLTTDGTGTTSWTTIGGSGDVVGPASSTDNAIARFDGITGKLIQNSLVIIDDLGNVTGVQNLTASGPIRTNTSVILQDPDTPANLVTIQASNATTGSYTLTLPIDDGTSGQFLSTNGSGVLSWSTPAGSGDVIGPASSTDNAIARFDGITGKLIQNSSVIIDDLGNVTGIQNLTVNGTTNTTALNIDSESISGQRIFSGYDSIGLTSISNIYQTLVINTNVINDTGYTNTLGAITITDIGTYDVFYHVQFQTFNNSAGQYASITARLELDTGGGFNPISGSGSSCFIIEQNGNLISPGTGKEVIVNITVPNSIIRVTFARTTGTTTGKTKAEESSLIIKRLRP